MDDIRYLRKIKKDSDLLNALNNEDFISQFNSDIIDQLGLYVSSIENCDFNCEEVKYLANTSSDDVLTLLTLISTYTKPINNGMAIMKRIGKYGDINNENFYDVKKNVKGTRKSILFN